MKTTTLGWIACVSLTLGACNGTGTSGTGTGSTAAPATGAKASTVAETAREKAAEALSAAAAAVKPRREVQLAPGTVVTVRTTHALSTVRDRAKDPVTATLDEPVLVNDVEVLPRGTKFTGHVTASEASGHMEGRAVLGLTLDAFEVNGERYPVATSVNTRTTEGHKKRNITAIGGGAGVGALIGGIAGGGKGAAIGAAVGAGAGTGAAAATGKQNIEIPAETRFRFTLKDAVTIVE
jgi:hypothetical protein